MITKRRRDARRQIEMVAIEDLVPEEHLVRKIEAEINFDFIYELVEDKYSQDNGRPSIDPAG